MNENADIDKLSFPEYAALMAEIGAKKYGNPDTTKLSFEELVASEMTFGEIEAEYGEETAINAGIARDPDTSELDAEWFARARPMREIDPEFVEWWEQNKDNLPPAKEWTKLPIDYDILDHFRAIGPDWHKRLNDTLRKAVFGDEKA